MFARSLSFDVDFNGDYILYFSRRKAQLVRRGFGPLWVKRCKKEILNAQISSSKIYLFFRDKILKFNLYGEKLLELETPEEIWTGKVNPDTEEIIALGGEKTYCYSSGSWTEHSFPNGYVHRGKFVGISSGRVKEEEMAGVEEIAFNNTLFVALTQEGEIWVRRLDGSGESTIKDLPENVRIKLCGPILQVITEEGAYSLPLGTMNLGKEIVLDSFTKVFAFSRGIASSEGVFVLRENALYDLKRGSAYSISGPLTFIRGGDTVGVLLEGYRLFFPSKGKIFELMDNFEKIGKIIEGKTSLSRGLFLAIFDISLGEVLRRYNALDEIVDHMANSKGEAVLIFPEHVEIYKEEETMEFKLRSKDHFLSAGSLFLATEDGLYEILLKGGTEKLIGEGNFELVDYREGKLAAIDFDDRLHFWERSGEEFIKKWVIELSTLSLDMKISDDGIYVVSPSEYLKIDFEGRILKREGICQ